MTPPSPAQVWRDGLWQNNPGLVQLLGLCPLLAVSNSLVNGLGLGLATLLVLVTANTLVNLIRPLLQREIRIALFVLIIASAVTAVELAMNAWFHRMYLSLGLFIPLIVTNCAIIGRAEAFASRQPLKLAVLDGLAHGLGFAAVLLMLGGMRELIGQGSLFAGAHLLLGDWARALLIELPEVYPGFLIAVLPPGAFIGLGLLVALHRHLVTRPPRHRPSPAGREAPQTTPQGDAA